MLERKLGSASLLALVEVDMSMQSTTSVKILGLRERDTRSFTTICAFIELNFKAWAHLGALSLILMNLDV